MQTHPTHRTRRARRFIATAVLLALTPLIFAACTDEEPEDTPAEATTATSPATTAASDATATATEAMTETATAATATATEAMTETPAASGGTTISVATEGDLAPYLVGPQGMTLYLFTNDEEGVSNCTEGCLANWPPLLVEEGEEPTASDDAPGELGVIEREDGVGRQVTYNGMPLYYWQGDTAPGDTTGHEVGGVWFVVPPTDSTASAPVSGGGSNLPGY